MDAESRDEVRARQILDKVQEKPERPTFSKKKNNALEGYKFETTIWRRSVLEILDLHEMDALILQVARSYSDVQMIEEKCTFEEVAILYSQKQMS